MGHGCGCYRSRVGAGRRAYRAEDDEGCLHERDDEERVVWTKEKGREGVRRRDDTLREGKHAQQRDGNLNSLYMPSCLERAALTKREALRETEEPIAAEDGHEQQLEPEEASRKRDVARGRRSTTATAKAYSAAHHASRVATHDDGIAATRVI